MPILLFFILFLSACASFDKTNIPPDYRVYGPGYSFKTPTFGAWFAVEYGTGHRIKLSQLNHDDSYAVTTALNRGPYRGMYASAETHLLALKRHMANKRFHKGFVNYTHEESLASEFGELCVRYQYTGQDWAGRNNAGAASIAVIGLNCPHPALNNVLIQIELSRRYETYAKEHDIKNDAEALFSSLVLETGD